MSLCLLDPRLRQAKRKRMFSTKKTFFSENDNDDAGRRSKTLKRLRDRKKKFVGMKERARERG